ncbi:unnamed protein product [marine sediment metagenome]|uniref:Uncharacterized protein n=1 Tax=marine sediment metagenome TaxID=412755 RepID=X1K5C5_9ZZZZ
MKNKIASLTLAMTWFMSIYLQNPSQRFLSCWNNGFFGAYLSAQTTACTQDFINDDSLFIGTFPVNSRASDFKTPAALRTLI